MTQPSPEAVMANVASNAQDLERAKEHARLLLEKVASGPIGDGLSHAEYALLCLHAHVTALTTQLEAERQSKSLAVMALAMCAEDKDDLTTRLAAATARAEAAEADKIKSLLRDARRILQPIATQRAYEVRNQIDAALPTPAQADGGAR